MKSVETTRRSFIGGAASTAALVGPLAIAGSATTGKGAGQRPLLDPTPLSGKTAGTDEADRWRALVGERFVIAGGGTTVGAKLASAKVATFADAKPRSVRQQSLTLAFALDGGAAVPETIFSVTSAAGIATSFFMQPGGDAASGTRLVALLN